MFYLILCDSDNSFCTVKDKNVVHDPDSPPGVDDEVQFYWGKKLFTGTIKNISEDAEELKKAAKQLQSRRSQSDSSSTPSPLPNKRLRKPKRVWSFEQNEPDDFLGKNEFETDKNTTTIQKKNASSAVQQQVKTLIDKNKSSVLKESRVKSTYSKKDLQESPTKEELKRMIQEKNELLESIQSSSSQRSLFVPQKKKTVLDTDNENSDSDKSLEVSKDKCKGKKRKFNDRNIDNKFLNEVITKEETDEENLSPQLFGKNSGEPMKLLKNNIYCKQSAYDDAVSNSRKSATSFLRRLMDGVFKRSAITNCTYSGRPPRAQGKKRQSEKFDALDRIAKTTVEEFCEKYAVDNGWAKPVRGELRNCMSQWLGEIKREHKNNLERNA